MRGEILIDIESFYTSYGPMVLRRCRRMLKNEQSAYDAMHEVFLKVVSNQNRLTGEYPSALLYRMATNVCLNKIRNERKHSLNEYLNVLHNTSFFESEEQGTSSTNLLNYILEKEKDTPRKIAVMYFVDGMTIKEIAATMRLSISGVHKHLDKVRQRIKNKGGV